jgi:carbon storage regulator
MLVLSRKKNESIVFGDGHVFLTVIEIRGDKVRLGIEAPKDVSVHRREVYDAIKREQANKEGSENTTPED